MRPIHWIGAVCLTVLAGVLVVVLQPCGGAPTPAPLSPSSADTEPIRGGTLVVAVGGDVHSFNPLIARGSTTMDVLEHMFPCLFSATFDGSLRFGPGLAESWTFDGADLTLRLRQDLTWQDGDPVDADDVIFTLEASADPAVGSPRLPALGVLREESPWEQIDASTVLLHFREPGRPETLLANVARALVVPHHVLDDIERDQLRSASFGSQPVAAGPFLLERWDRGEQIVLQGRAGGPALLDRVVLRVIADPTTRRMAYATGEVDLLPSVDVADLKALTDARPGTQVVRRGYRFVEYIGWNLRDPRFADVRVRRALAHAVDVDALIAALLTAGDERYGKRATGTITPELTGAVDETIAPLGYDPQRAATLLADAGWVDHDGDGTVDRDGTPLQFALLYASGNERRKLTAEVVQAQLAQIGVRAEPMVMERHALRERLRAREFEAVLAGWAAGLAIDPSPVWHSGEPSEFNFVGYDNPVVNAVIDRGLAAQDAAEADVAWREMQRLIYDDQPYCFLFWIDDVAVVAPHVRDAEVGILGAFHHLDRWWLDDPQ